MELAIFMWVLNLMTMETQIHKMKTIEYCTQQATGLMNENHLAMAGCFYKMSKPPFMQEN